MQQTPTHRILSGVAASISQPILDQDGALNATAAVVTYGVTAADGSPVVAAGTAATTTTGVAVGSLTAAQTATLGILTFSWTDDGQVVATSTVEVVGGYFASIQEIRQSDPSIESNPQKHTNAKIVRVRREAEMLFEDVTGRAFVPRFNRQRVSGMGTDRVVLPTWDLRRIRSVRDYTNATTYTAWTQAEVDSVPASGSGVAVRTDLGVWTAGCENLVVEWEHGLTAPPADLKSAFLTYTRYLLHQDVSGVPARATAIVDGPGGGTFRISTPGIGKSITGLPEVDEVLDRYRRISIGIA